MTSFEDYPLTSSRVMQMQIEGHGIGTMNEVLKTNTHSDNISNSENANTNANTNANAPHFLSDTWILWAHLPHDTDWSIKSYTKIFEFNTLEQAVTITEMLPPKLIVNCMLFLMRKGINPIWEDERNRNGGCFSYKIINKDVPGAWKQMSYLLVGETMTDNVKMLSHINGITISPKKNFCIMKVWVANCLFQDATVIRDVEGVSSHGCLFKRHVPEY